MMQDFICVVILEMPIQKFKKGPPGVFHGDLIAVVGPRA